MAQTEYIMIARDVWEHLVESAESREEDPWYTCAQEILVADHIQSCHGGKVDGL